MEVLTCRATSDGYHLTFTQSMDRATLEDVASYRLENYTYKLHSPYGSPEGDHGVVTVESAVAAADGKSVTLKLGGAGAMRIGGYVTEMHLDGVRSTDGEKLLHPEVYATLNVIP